MSDTAKTSTAGSSQGRGNRRHRLALAATLLALGALTFAASSASAAEAPKELWTQCKAGPGAGQCNIPRGIAADPNLPGHLYVADQANDRINEFTAWGVFVKSWGWGVRDGAAELQTCGPGATPPSAACFEERLRGPGAGQFTSPNGVAVDSKGDVYVVDSNNSRVQKFDPEGNFLRTWGGGVISGGAAGSGDLTAGSTMVRSLTTTAKAFLVSQTLGGAGIAPGTTITGLGGGRMTLSKPATASGTGIALTAAAGAGNVPTDEQQTVTLLGSPGGGSFTLTTTGGEVRGNLTEGSNQLATTPTNLVNGTIRAGDAISGSGIPSGATIAAIDASTGVVTLSANATSTQTNFPYNATETTAPIPFDAPASGPGSVQAALESLANVGAGSVSAGGPPGGPYTVAFTGPLLADVDLPQMSAKESLTPSGTVKVATAVQGAGAAEVCAVAADCRKGIEGPGNGQFAKWTNGNFIAIDPGAPDTIYVGDRERIQEFEPDGAYIGNLPDPESVLAGKTVQSLAVGPSGDLYVAFDEKPNVLKLSPAGVLLDTLEVKKPTAIAIDVAGNVYVVDRVFHPEDATTTSEVLQFDPAGNKLDLDPEGPGFGFGGDILVASTGIASSSACFAAGSDLYVANSSQANAFIRAYGLNPDNPACPPPPAPPSIEVQYAISVGSGEAVLGAQINPHFWSGTEGETDYYVQYGTAECVEAGWEAPCVKKQPAPPGAKLISGVVNEPVTTAGVFLTGLSPDTEYSYRFVAEGDGAPGEPVAGAGGKPGEDGKAGTFTTFPLPGELNEKCENQAFRSGPSAALPDCRAYEMVSPIDKEGGDIALGPNERLDQSATSGNKLTYTSKRPPYSQYVAARDAGEGWSSEPIDPTQEGEAFDLESEGPFATFSADLSEAWLRTAYEPVLAAGGVGGFDNLYRRESAGGTYEACTTAEPPNIEPGEYAPEVQGVSADGGHRAVFAAPDQLTPAAAPSGGELGHRRQLYECHDGQLSLLSVLPGRAASELWNTVGTANDSAYLSRTATLAGAVSGDASRVYWTATGGQSGSGALYLRLNPEAPESARLHGAATGAGNLIGPATGIGKTVKNSNILTKVDTKSGEFAVGQEISAAFGGAGCCIPAGTKITAIEEVEEEVLEEKVKRLVLTLDKAATVGKVTAELIGAASKTVSNLSTDTGAFVAGQEISGAGIPPGVTIAAVAGSTLTLSAAATQTGAGAALEAYSACTEAAKACTIGVSGGAAHFWAARPDASKALFNEGEDLYRFDAVSGEATPIAAKVIGVLGASEDLSRVYLLSAEALGGEAQAGQPNLYLYEGGGLTFIATLSVRDGATAGGEFSPANPRPSLHTARVSPDGAALAFMSNSGPLSELVAGYDNTDAESPAPCGAKGGICDAEIYHYDSGSEELHCVSCNRSGSRPAGREVGAAGEGEETGLWAPALLPAWETSLYPTHVLAEDGHRLFFESFEPLVISDTNGKADVYQWEAPSTGDCEAGKAAFSPPNGGCVTLISSGKGAEDSEFVDADPDGSDAFFASGESLLSTDPGEADLYDARVGGGFASGIVKYALTVKKTGTGTGKVTSAPAGIDCGSDCEEPYEEGKEVTLTQLADAGSEFVKWTGACIGSGTCKVTMSAAKEVTAEFKLTVKPKFKLTISKSGTGTGTITGGSPAEPNTINCGSTCEHEYEEGAVVTLGKAASAGSEFKEWTGACTGSGACEVTISSAKAVGAKFDLIARTLTIAKAGSGTGEVKCKAGAGPAEACAASYPNATALKVEATASAGSTFAGFSAGTGSATACSTSPCSFAIEANSALTATFNIAIKPKFKLTVSKSGTGTGTITGGSPAEPNTINCGASCEHEYEEGAVVTLGKAASPGSEFKEWTGACTGTGACEVTMSAAKAVGAKFDLIARTLTIAKAGSGTGEVKCKAGAGPAEACAASYPNATALKVEATASAGSTFAGFSAGTGSATACSTSPCSFAIEANSALTATFNIAIKPKFKLTVSKSGTGTGTITGGSPAEPNTINCGSTCEHEYEEGAVVTLGKAASAGSEFKEWTGACTGTGACEVTISAAKAVGAVFNLIPRTLSITKAGTGTGEVKCKVGAGSAEPCAASYPNGTALKVEATANAGSSFAGFSAGTGSAAGCATSPCSFAIEANSSVTATFNLAAKPKFKLTVTKSGSGQGTVTSLAPNTGIACGTGAGCEAEFDEGTEVTLSQSATAGSEFKEWTGACTGSGACKVTMSTAKAVGAKFDPIPRTLSITKAGSGSGEVKCKFNAGSAGACTSPQPNGTAVEVIATANAGSSFAGFSAGTGSATACSTSPCSFAIEANSALTATFNTVVKPKFKLTVSKSGMGTGTLTSTPAGINCGSGATCEAEFDEGTEVTLSQSASAGSEFKEWTGACTGSGACKVTMSAAKAVGAKFDLIARTLTIAKAGTGTGEVKCKFNGGSAGACTSPQPNATAVEVIATANAGSTFAGFSAGTGSAAGCTTSPCSFAIEANSALTATFNTIVKPKFKLTVSKSGSGTGTVTSTPAGINCGATCEAEYDEGTEVTLSPAATSGSEFKEWSGACTGSGACKVTMSAAKAVGAKFEPHQLEYTLTIEVSGNGSGLVSCDGGACAASYPEEAEVTLSASAIAGSFFAGWSGEGCSGTGTCEVTIEADTTIVAKFSVNPFSPPPPPFQKGTALAAGIASVQGESALIRLLCPAGERCTGTLELFARLQSPSFGHRHFHHGPPKRTLIGTASFDLAPQSKASIAVKITSARALRLLARSGTLSAQLLGTSVRSRTVRLVGPQVRRHRG